MRVQRAPSAAEQPQRPLSDTVPAPATSSGFSAEVDLDLTALLSRLDASKATGEVIARLVAACRREQLVDERVVLRLVRLTDDGLVGVCLDAAVNQSADAISSSLRSPARELPAATARTLTVLTGSRVRTTGGWGGLGVATLDRLVPTLASSPEHGLSVMQRYVARLGLTVHGDPHRVVRALDSVARSLGC